MEEKKYVLSNEQTMSNSDGKFRRVWAVRDIPKYNVKAGDYGGFVAHERCLAQYGDSWVGGNAIVYEGGYVNRNALVTGNAQIRGFVGESAIVIDNAIIWRGAEVGGEAFISKNAQIQNGATVTGKAKVTDNAVIESGMFLTGDIEVKSNTDIVSVLGLPFTLVASKEGVTVITPDLHNTSVFSKTVRLQAAPFEEALTATLDAIKEPNLSTKLAYIRLFEAVKSIVEIQQK